MLSVEEKIAKAGKRHASEGRLVATAVLTAENSLPVVSPGDSFSWSGNHKESMDHTHVLSPTTETFIMMDED